MYSFTATDGWRPVQWVLSPALVAHVFSCGMIPKDKHLNVGCVTTRPTVPNGCAQMVLADCNSCAAQEVHEKQRDAVAE